jgi:hypothetical protein
LYTDKEVFTLASKYKHFKRNTLGGEYASMLENAHSKGIPVKLDFSAFCGIVTKPCDFCGGTTKGYEGNAISYRTKEKGYDTSARSTCWKCKNMLNRAPKGCFEHAVKIVTYCKGVFPE